MADSSRRSSGEGGRGHTRLPERVRGEIVVVLESSPSPGEAGKPRAGSETVRRNLSMLMDSGFGVKKAAAIVADLSGLPSRVAYDLGLEIREERKKTRPPADRLEA